MKKKITKQEYYALLGLFEMVRRYNKYLLETESVVAEILGNERDKYGWHHGHIQDRIWDENADVDSMLSDLKIKVEST